MAEHLMPLDPFSSGHQLADLLDEGEVILLALAEAGDRGSLGPALDALETDEHRTALLFWLVEVRRGLRAIVRRRGSLSLDRKGASSGRHHELGELLRDLMVEAAEVEDRAARRIALRLDALPDEMIEVLLEDVLQARR